MGSGGAEHEAVRARLNLLAVLPNLEDVVRHDPEMAALVGEARITVEFIVRGGPDARVCFAGGVCTVEAGSSSAPEASAASRVSEASGMPDALAVSETPSAVETPTVSVAGARVALWFTSPSHLNKMFDGAGTPIPLRGFGKLGFLRNEFTRLTQRLSYYLEPSDELLADRAYLEMNTRLTLNTAAFAVPVLLEHDPQARLFRDTFADGSIALTVLPDGPSVGLLCGPREVRAVKGDIASPTALVRMADMRVAGAFLNGKLDTFAAVARGDVEIWGQIPKVDVLSLVLDRIPTYLS